MKNITISGEKELQAALKSFGVQIDKAVDEVVAATAFQVQKNAVQSIANQSPGKPKKRGNVTHIQSKEGDAPNADTGRLMGSIEVDHDKGSKTALVGTNLDYGAILETTHNRPWLAPAKDKEVPAFKAKVQNAVNDQIIKAGK